MVLLVFVIVGEFECFAGWNNSEDILKISEISEDLILAQASIFLVGGFDTSGSAITWAILELAQNPSIQVICNLI